MVCGDCECALESCMVSYAITQRSSYDVTARPFMAYGANRASKPKLPPSTQTKDPSGALTACNVLTPSCPLQLPRLRFMPLKYELMLSHLVENGSTFWQPGTMSKRWDGFTSLH